MAWQMNFKIWLLLVLWVGCTPREFKSLDNITLSCNVDADCPETYFCETRLKDHECRLLDDRDLSLPKATESALSVVQAKVGTQVVATFTSDKVMVQAELKVFVGDDSELNRFTENAENADLEANSFEFIYEITGQEGEGTRTVKAFLKDTNGNESTVDLGVLELDFTAPVISELALADETPLASGATGKVLFTLSEDVVLEVTTSHEIDLIRDETIEAPSYGYSYTVTQDDPETQVTDGGGDHRLSVIIQATDTAGNASTGEIEFNALDFTPPAVSSASLPQTLLRPGDVLRANVVLDEESQALPKVMAVMRVTQSDGGVEEISIDLIPGRSYRSRWHLHADPQRGGRCFGQRDARGGFGRCGL
jgi:hypothetical protein